ncbi:MAG: sigma 54-interacting transcriptional regulator [Thermodesulfovibrionales bacterium]|nr:sigma 54-interacting transcriptional regulator [Thermodesulfovibrionales bacterium]
MSFADITHLVLSDTGLMFSLLCSVKERYPQKDFTLIHPTISLIGERGLVSLIEGFDCILEEDTYPLWAFAMMLKVSAINLNKRANIAEEEHVIISSQLPVLGYLIMYQKHPHIKRLLPLLLKIPLEDSIFIQERLFKTNHITEIQKITNMPSLFHTTCSMVGLVYSNTGKRLEEFDHPMLFSDNYMAFQLFKVMEIAVLASQNILFPQVIEAQERCKENMKKYYSIPENEYEEFLCDIIMQFESEGRYFGQGSLFEDMIEYAQRYRHGSLRFTTTDESFNNNLNQFYVANSQGRNLFIWGEADVGKRLLLASVHQREDNPNRQKPLVSIYCSGISNDNFEVEFFGSKGGFFGFQKIRGAFDIAKEGGTVLLKNIDKMPIDLQNKIARVIKDGFFYKLGEMKPTRFDCRFYLTSRTAPEDKSRISELLLKAINPHIIHIPPLRERRQDIEIIADAIIRKYELPIYDNTMLVGLREYYQYDEFQYNLLDLKRLLFFVSAKKILLDSSR